MAMKIDVNSSKILFSGVVSVLLLVLTIVGVNAWFLRYEQTEEAAKADRFPNTALADVRQAQSTQINSYGKNRDSAKQTIPVANAAILLVQSNGKMPATQPSAAPATPAPAATTPAPAKPEEKKPEDKKPEEPKPEPAKTEEKKPEDKKPDEAKPEASKPEEKKPEAKKPDEAKSEEKKPEEKKADEAKVDAPKSEDKKAE